MGVATRSRCMYGLIPKYAQQCTIANRESLGDNWMVAWVEGSEKTVGDSGTVISELWSLPKLNLSRIDAERRIGFRSVGEGGLEGSERGVVEPFSQSSLSFSIIVPPRPNTVRLAHWTRSLNFTLSSNEPLPPLNISLNSSEALLAYWWIWVRALGFRIARPA